ncbi:N-acetylmuramoyl-L-alanine amidase family protein [Bacillus mycoides]|uniref:N-acetylmuramoyl-L-alanine amidase family protein n=1 Tax=Bacillus mycoides TaxID=1405 RepID=UPI0037F59755
MKSQKLSKKKMLSTFTASAILATCLLPASTMVHAEEKVAQEKQVQNSGFQTIDGKTYYFGQKNDGTGLAEGEKAIWTVNINGKSHYFSGDGSARAANSWLADYHQDGAPNTWYILEKGEKASSWQQIDGKWYYFDPNNDYRMVSNWKQIDGKWYYFDPNNNNKMALGWEEINGKWYYLSKKGDGLINLVEGEMTSGFQTIDGKTYYFGQKHDETGLTEGEMAKDWFKIGEDWYRTNEDGAQNFGTLNMASDKYFFDKKTGKSLGSIRKDVELKYIAGASGPVRVVGFYGYGPEGKNATRIQGLHEFNGEKYYFDGNGEMATDWKEIDGNWYYFDSSGKAADSGWKQQTFNFAWAKWNWYYFNSDGKMATGWKKSDGKLYYFAQKNDDFGDFGEGTMVRGMKRINGKLYQFDSDNGACAGEVGRDGNGHTILIYPKVDAS